jgi:hypothetical protein
MYYFVIKTHVVLNDLVICCATHLGKVKNKPNVMNLVKRRRLAVLSIVLLTTLVFSCSSRVEPVFEITNATNCLIENLTIQPDKNENNHIIIEPNKKAKLTINMANLPKIDGGYYLQFTCCNAAKQYGFGYYTNGQPIESITRISVLADTIIVKPEYKSSY